jgi:hypothetical protein
VDMLPVLKTGIQKTLNQDHANNMWQLQGKILLETNFIQIYVLNYIFLPSNILCISLYIAAWPFAPCCRFGHVKEPCDYMEVGSQAKLASHFSPDSSTFCY